MLWEESEKLAVAKNQPQGPRLPVDLSFLLMLHQACFFSPEARCILAYKWLYLLNVLSLLYTADSIEVPAL